MADIFEAELDYWRITYGIHLVGYATVEHADKSRDHSPLLEVLDDLLRVAPPIAIPGSNTVVSAPCPPDTVLALARHAGRLTRAPKSEPEFPLRVHVEERGGRKGLPYSQPDEFDHCPVERFLDNGPTRAILIGLPGSGKSEIPRRIEGSLPFEDEIEFAVEYSLPLSDSHEPELRSLMKLRSTIGAAAVTRLVELKGASVKDELLQSLSEARDDYNYCVNGIGTALSRFATPDDVPKIVALADGIQNEFPPHGDRRVVQGFSSGAATFLAGLDVLVVKQWFLPTDEPGRPSELKARILCEILHRHHVTAALDFAGELLLRGVDEAATAIYFISQFSKPEDQLSWANFTSDHVDRLVSGLDEEKEEVWALRALRCLCEARPDLASTVMAHALKASGIAKVALLYCASSSNTAAVFQALAELVEMDAAKRRGEPIYILKQIELDWAGHEALLVQLFRLRDTRLALALLGEVYHGVGI